MPRFSGTIVIGILYYYDGKWGQQMKKLALFMDGWKRFFTYAWPAGILQRIDETNEDVGLYIFNSSGSWNRDENYNVGEYNIYRLPDMNDFDGIIVDLNNIRHQEVCDYIIEAAKKTGKPVVSVANECEDFYYVGIDNYAAMQEIIDHLYRTHNCKKFWLVMGPENNYENNIRAQALMDYMKEHEIPFDDSDIYYENYEFNCGVNGFNRLTESHDGVPDAIICANDNIAVGVCEAATKKGYEVPRDFCVTGFDDFDKASYYSPQLTTVSHIREEVGYACMELFLKLWDGETIPKFNYTKHTAVFRQSCGCGEYVEIDQREHLKNQILYGIETGEFEEQMLALEHQLLQCRSVQEMPQWIPKCIPMLQCDAMYLVVDEHMDDFRRETEHFDKYHIEDEEFCVEGYPQKMRLEFAYENGRVVETDARMVEALFPLFETEERGADVLFLPLHFRQYTVGYLVIRNAVYLMEKQYLSRIVNVLTSAMENLHKKERLEYMNRILSDLYIKDTMTGLYNRLGYQKLVCSLFEQKKREKENLSIVFMDMDHLKYINDRFGHIYGDWAIKTIGAAILKHCPKGAIPIRNGGDEFLIMLETADDTITAEMIQKIREELEDKAKQMNVPFPFSVSAGCIVTDMECDKNLDDYVREADESMYEEKTAKKANRK